MTDLHTAKDEACSVYQHLLPLEPTLRTLSEQADVTTITAALPKLMAGILMGWKHSVHSRTPARLGAMLYAVSNDVVNMGLEYLGGA